MKTGAGPKIIGFYAYKGGTGRTFCLAHTAWALARDGWRIAVIDLDLSAPSLGMLFGKTPAPGLVEYVTHWSRRKPLQVRDLIEEVPLDPKASGALFLLQAGKMDQAYLDALQTLDWQELLEQPPLRRHSPSGALFDLSSPFDDLFTEITEQLQPDALLIDAPTGLNDASNLCLRSLADLVIAIFGATRVQLEGIGRVVSLLTAEQQSRRNRNEEPRPDVFCVASTILGAAITGVRMKRVQDAFAFLEQVRYDAVGRPEDLRGELQDTVRQEQAALIAYDDRLADLESLPTEQEPRQNHFAAFSDVINYVSGAIPPPRPRTELDSDTKSQVLEELTLGFNPIAEQDSLLLTSLFLRTQHVQHLRDPRVVLVTGGKGSGKTALFSYATTAEGGALAVHGPQRRLAPDILCKIQDDLPTMDVFWRLYVLAALPEERTARIRDSEVRSAVRTLAQLLEGPALIDEAIRQLKRDLGVRVLAVWKQLDSEWAAERTAMTFCLDGLDTAFKGDTERRKRGLADLFTAWQSTFAALTAVQIKVFLRSDLWQSLCFPEKSHFRGKELKLTWDRHDLWRMVIKRALSSPEFSEWCERACPLPVPNGDAIETAGERDLHPVLDRLFEHHIWAGKNSLSRNWVLRRLEDAREAVYPRDLICLLQEAIPSERERLREGQRVADDAVLSRQSLSDALDPTSRQRVDAVREEFPELVDTLERLRGLNASGPIDELKERGVVPGMIELLTEAGVMSLNQSGKYAVPDLYRHGLDMPRMGPK